MTRFSVNFVNFFSIKSTLGMMMILKILNMSAMIVSTIGIPNIAEE